MDNTLQFRPLEVIEEEVPNTLSHISISINLDSFIVKEERGLEELNKYFKTKDELIEYIKEHL